MLELLLQVVLPLVGLLAGGGGLVGLVQARALLRKAGSESAKLMAEARRIEAETDSLVKRADLDRYALLVDDLQKDNAQLRKSLNQTDARIEQLRAALSTMADQYQRQTAEMEVRHQAEMVERDRQTSAMEERYRHAIATLRAGVRVLVNQLRRMGCQPDWEPEWAAEPEGGDGR